MRVTLRLGALLGALACAALFPALAPAQQAEKNGAENKQVPPEVEGIVGPDLAPPPGIEAIEVTGESLDSTNVQDDAEAVTAFDMGALDKLGITNVDGLAANVPGLHIGQQGQNAIITLRGVGTENASITGEPGVAFHVDGIYYGSPAAARTAFYDIQMIEVKRGPQGLVGGKNSTSGAINVTTNDPTQDFEIQGDYTLGNYDRQRARGYINIPVGEMVSGRLSVFYEERDGYLERQRVIPNFPITNIPNEATAATKKIVDLSDSDDPFDLDNWGLRGKVRFQPSETFDMVVGYNYFSEGGNGPQADIVPLKDTPCRIPAGAALPIPAGYTTRMGIVGGCRVVNRSLNPTVQSYSFYPSTTDLNPRKTYTDFGSSQDDTYWGWSGKAEWESPALPMLGTTTLKLLQGFQDNKVGFNWDFDGSDQEIFNLFGKTEVKETTSELQWAGGERLVWQASLFFQRQTGESRLISPGSEAIPDPTVTKVPTFSSVASYQNTINFDTEQTTKNKSYGASLHGEYALTDSVTFSLGGRWNKDRKETYLAQRRNLDGVVYEACEPRADKRDWSGRNPSLITELTPTGFAEPLPNSCSLLFRGTSWGSRLEWKPADDHLLYAGIDRGYKSGGFASGGFGSYKPEKIWAYSLGSKSEFFDQRFQLNLEGFFYNYQDMQLTLIDATKLRTENADTRMYGAELEARANPIEGLRLTGLVSYLHTEIIEYLSMDPAHLGLEPNRSRITRRDAVERRGYVYPDGPTQGGEVCQTPHSELVNGVPTFFPRRLCRQFGDSNGLDDFSGNQLSRSPEWKWNVSAEYDIPLGRYGTLTPGVKYDWQDDAYFRVFNQDFDLQEAYHTTNLRLQWTSPEQMWDVEAFVNNVENNAIKQNILIGPSTFGSIPLAWYGEPRFWGFKVGFKY